MRVIYGKDSSRIELSNASLDLSWSSSRGQIAQYCEMMIANSPAIQAAGFLMMFEGPLEVRNQIFHGPIINTSKNDKTSEARATAYELAWYLQKNDSSPIFLNGDAGKELERVIKSTGIQFTCPSFGFAIKERVNSQSYASLYSYLTEKAYEKTGIRYYLQHTRDQLEVKAEGSNTLVPVFQANLLLDSETGQSLEEVYTVITVEKYKNDKVVSTVTKENTTLSKQIGKMRKVIDAGEDSNLSGLADRQLANLGKIPTTRSITVQHQDPSAAKLRAGWKIKIAEMGNTSITDWIVTGCNARWKGEFYTMNLDLERK